MEANTYNVGILGASGAVGQRFIELLLTSKTFNLVAVGGSINTVGKTIREVSLSRAAFAKELKNSVANLIVVACEPENFKECDLVFSGLDASVAGEIESKFASSGIPVFSNARNHRYDADVPILIPSVNADHIESVRLQSTFSSGGYIVTNPNCCCTGLAIILAPLHKHYGIDIVMASTCQAISGAGYPGISSMDILDNVIPFISGEEEKMTIEPRKMLGQFTGKAFEDAEIIVSAICNRVPTMDGHMVSASIKFSSKDATLNSLIEAGDKKKVCEFIQKQLTDYQPTDEVSSLPSFPSSCIQVFDYEETPNRPQPRLDRNFGGGFGVSVGCIRPCEVFHVKLCTLAHNVIIGAAGCAILNAELACSRGLVNRRS